MKKITLLLGISLLTCTSTFAQVSKAQADEDSENMKKKVEMDLTKLPNGWKKAGNLLLGFTYANHNGYWAGASEKYSATFNGGLTYNATRKHNRTLWLNDLNFVYQSIASPNTNGQFRKSNDLLTLSSMYAPQIKPKWFWGINGDLRTQVFNSYNYTAADTAGNFTKTGSFMTLGNARLGVGIMYTPSPKWRIYFSPLTANITTKLGAWAKPLAMGEVAANKNINFGLGALLRVDYMNTFKTGTLLGDISYKSRLDLFGDYLGSPFTVDADWINSLGFNLTKYVSVAAQVNFRYYKNVINEIQNQNMVGLGFSYKL